MADLIGLPPNTPPPGKEGGITESIHIPDWATVSDFTERDLARICRQISRLGNYLAGSMMKISAINTSSLPSAGAAHPVVRQLFQIAATSENCAIQLEGGPRVLPPGAMPGPGGSKSPFRC